ncbi:hypothetical protein Pmar_PMAR003444 [Perkinsus marinus ATCC 50983]|uniref:Uncharacterized protein n=1 Tax=Perkinsus marinus (strain ATCC 50983 / TXsc) TaxID=423536 RepID=C5KHC1_PERM5|nr:hypothetical protein Pmar_PMAR003444 [Perkinsus marinus ATCC 50983]EER15983.1 hypothetical protein Pmar_PMAR003444 [Perkinsus marinus ATCC 50983]|eukprot:XP_002784187.1 hypothetical protein Pmar_PMAR003444 [Perkinsus marinus ATCC 50983]
MGEYKRTSSKGLVSPRAPKRPRSGTETLDDASSDDGGLDGLMGLAFDDDLTAGLEAVVEESPCEEDFSNSVEDTIVPQVMWVSPPLLDRYTLCVVQDGGAELTVPMTWYRQRDSGDASVCSKEQQLRAVTSAATAAAKRSTHPMPVASSEKEKSHQMRREWDKQVNKLGKQLMIAMGYRGLDKDNRLSEWCAWLGVKLTYIGLSNNSYSKLPGVVPTGAVGDIDLCGNGLEDDHLHVLASTLKPFHRLRVKALHLDGNKLTGGQVLAVKKAGVDHGICFRTCCTLSPMRSAMCRVYGEHCDVHLECLGSQHPIEDIKYHENVANPVNEEIGTVIDMTPTEVADVVDLEDDD